VEQRAEGALQLNRHLHAKDMSKRKTRTNNEAEIE